MNVVNGLQAVLRLLNVLALFAVAMLAVATVGYLVLCVSGVAPWLQFSATFGDTTVTNAGTITQVALTTMIVLLALFIPTVSRINALEASHRTFHIKMDDVARAYHYAHTADRSGVFTLSSEFDAVRERLSYLRDHPDLERIDAEVLEVAAQMSQQSRQLADIYSDEKVARAKASLTQRQEEAEAQQDRIVQAMHDCQLIRKWAQQVDVEESIIASQLAQLDDRLQSALPHLGYAIEHEPNEILDAEHVADLDAGDDLDDDDATDDSNIVTLPKKPAAE